MPEPFMPFRPSSLSIRQLFGDVNSFYKIPNYQRPYIWVDEQVEKLWEDILEAYVNKENNYFLGSIITVQPRENKNSPYVDVVDGQQRMTTLMILFCVLRDLYPSINENSGDVVAINNYVIRDSIASQGRLERLKLTTHFQHQSDFERIVLNGDTRSLKKPTKKQLYSDESPEYKFKNTAVIFKEKLIAAQKEQDIANIINFIFNKIQLIRIDCQDKDFAIKLFQVLNDRGIDLTSADLIKSFLLENLCAIYADNRDTLKLREDQFIADWRSMEQEIKSCDISIDDLFVLYLYYLLGKNPKKSLSDELRVLLAKEDPNKVVAELKEISVIYVNSIYNANCKVMFSFRYIRWSMYWKSICLTAFYCKYNEINELLLMLRRFYYLYWMAGKNLSQIKQTSFNVIKWIKENKSVSEIEGELNDKIQKDNIINLAIMNLSTRELAFESWIKPLLILIEYNQTDDIMPSFIPLNNDLHLEHILPVKYSSYRDEWGHILDEEASLWLNSAGNLTLLGGRRNIEASNNPFQVKIEVYNGRGKYGNGNRRITAFSITQRILNDFNLRRFEQKWTVGAMIEREQWFFTQLSQVLTIDLNDLISRNQLQAA